MSASYNDWESDLSSIIEKTNNNLKLLRRIGDKRGDSGPPVVASAAAAPRVMVAGAGSARRYGAGDDDGASVGSRTSGRPRVMSNDSTSSASRHSPPRVVGSSSGGLTAAMLAQRDAAHAAHGGPPSLQRAHSSGSNGGVGLTAAMLAQRNSMPSGPVMSLGDYSRLSETERHSLVDREETRSHTGSHAGSSASRGRHSVVGGGSVSGGFNGSASGSNFNRPPSVVGVHTAQRAGSVIGVHTAQRAASVIGVPTSRPAGMGSGPTIRVASGDMPRTIPNYVIEDLKKRCVALCCLLMPIFPSNARLCCS